jgi:vacuolar-type H+-ATPase subunit F/Vma7
MARITVIAHGHLALQMRLAGLVVDEVADAAEAEEALELHIEAAEGFVVVEEALMAGFSESFEDRLAAHRGLPLVVSCPSFDSEESQVDSYLAEVLRPAVGYEIRLE